MKFLEPTVSGRSFVHPASQQAHNPMIKQATICVRPIQVLDLPLRRSVQREPRAEQRGINGGRAKINTPSPPAPMAAAIVAVPMVATVAIRSPARFVRIASGSSTSQRSCRPVIPIAIADSRTAGSIPRMPP